MILKVSCIHIVRTSWLDDDTKPIERLVDLTLESQESVSIQFIHFNSFL